MAEAEARSRGSASSSGGGDGGGAARETQGSGGGDEWVSAVAGMSDEEIATVIETSRQQGVWSEVPERGLGAAAPFHGDAEVWEQLKLWSPDAFRDMREGELKLGRMIGEGGQAQIYYASWNGHDGYVAKVFKMEGFSLAELQRQWPRIKRSLGGVVSGELEKFARSISGAPSSGGVVFGELEKFASSMSRAPFFAKLLPTAVDAVQVNPAAWGRAVFSEPGKFICHIYCGAFLEDGRFAFVMNRYWGDLRTIIDLRVKDNSQGPPFFPINACRIMKCIASGIKSLHDLGVLHRDLKAANVLIQPLNGCDPRYDNNFICRVADYESSMLVVGTGFWRAPEVLEELMKQPCDRKKDIWTKKVDAYSFAMTCYEVLTGQIPFFGYTRRDWKRIIDGERPHLPDYIDPKVQDLLKQCWHRNPSKRPSFKTIEAKFNNLRWH